ncbi:MAG: hypothetical protein R2771_01435 [Saprospiraceae bacterium]
MKRISANEADAFTTVSDITANECKYLLEKEVDVDYQMALKRLFSASTK